MGDIVPVPPPNLIPRFLDRCPEFQSRWDEHLADWGEEEAGAYNNLAELAHFIVDAYTASDLEIVQRALNLVEEILEENDPATTKLVVIGLIEDIQTIGSNRDFGSAAFEPLLGDMSMQAWREIQSQWEGKSSLMDVIRAERKSDDT